MPQQYVAEAGHAPELSIATTSDLSDLSCGVCHKRYVRQCDLNKHYKTHSRPFKCPVPGCKFQERGWPTEKELLRHQNDKHSESPRVFRCRFQPCDYTSKRESNCKQHMEKNHGWHYARSRPPRQSLPSGANTSGRLESQEQEGSSPCGHAEDDGAAELADPPVFPWAHHPHPSPLDPRLHAPEVAANNQAIGHSLPVDIPAGAQEPLHDLENLDSADKESDAFLPWDSPPTKLKKMETVLAQLPPSLFAATAAAWSAPPDATSGGVEPLFSPPIKVAHSPISDIMPPAPYDASCSGIGGYGDYPDCGQVDFGGADTEHKAKHEHAPHYKRSVDHMSTGAILGTDTHSGPGGNEDADGDLDSRQDEDAEGDEDEDGDDDPPPRKKAKASLEGDFNDAEMECPFRLANPDVYKREKSSRYSSCYTPHTQISTIVRHFKRAAHRLTAEDLYISSFDVSSAAGIRHPAAGLCRKCWRAFSDRGEFSRHVSERGCSRVSRSKREKFRLLHDTFCIALPDERPPTSSSAQAIQPAGSGPPPPTTAIAYQDGSGAPPITSPTAPAATQPSSTGAAAGQAGTSQSLTQRVEALEQTTTQLLRMVTSIIARDDDDGRASHHHRLQQLGESVAWPAGAAPGPRRQDSGMSDKESLVGGMTSQSTDVDRNGLIREVNRTLSTVSSDTDRSAIRHVPHAESQDLHAAKPHASGSNMDETHGTVHSHSHSHSITDSGFVSDGHVGDGGGMTSVPIGGGSGGGSGDVSAPSATRVEDETASSLSGLLESNGSQSHVSFGQTREHIPSEFFKDAISAYEETYGESRGPWP